MHRAEGDRLVGARQDVPLVVGLADGESFLASDVAAILAHTDQIIFLEEGDVVDLRPWGVVITDKFGEDREREITTIDWTPEAAEKGGYEHFMLKEIHEQPEALAQSIAGRVTTRRPDPASRRSTGVLEHAPGGRPDRAGRLRQRVLRGPDRRGGPPGLDRDPGPRDRRVGVPLQPAAARRAHARSSR